MKWVFYVRHFVYRIEGGRDNERERESEYCGQQYYEAFMTSRDFSYIFFIFVSMKWAFYMMRHFVYRIEGGREG